MCRFPTHTYTDARADTHSYIYSSAFLSAMTVRVNSFALDLKFHSSMTNLIK